MRELLFFLLWELPPLKNSLGPHPGRNVFFRQSLWMWTGVWSLFLFAPPHYAYELRIRKATLMEYFDILVGTVICDESVKPQYHRCPLGGSPTWFQKPLGIKGLLLSPVSIFTVGSTSQYERTSPDNWSPWKERQDTEETSPKSCLACPCASVSQIRASQHGKKATLLLKQSGSSFEGQSLLKKWFKTCCRYTNTLISQALPFTAFVLNNMGNVTVW